MRRREARGVGVGPQRQQASGGSGPREPLKKLTAHFDRRKYSESMASRQIPLFEVGPSAPTLQGSRRRGARGRASMACPKRVNAQTTRAIRKCTSARR